MYTNTTGTPTLGTLSAAQVEMLKEQVLAVTGAGQPCTGFSDAQIAGYLNAPQQVLNPSPNMIAAPGGVLTPAQFGDVLLRLRNIVWGNGVLISELTNLGTKLP